MNGLKYSIIPKPQRYDTVDGTYTVTSDTAVLCVPEFKKAGMYLSNFLKTKKDASEGTIKFKKDPSVKSEGYHLVINSEGITVTSSDEHGAFYGAVTLKTVILQSKQGNGKAVLNGADIYDYPKYEFRSGMLDESRHFFGVDAVKRLLDDMAMLKLNKFHWHLSDDQGYRIESEVFPLLNEISSKRKYEYLGGQGVLSFMKCEGGEYCSYYKKSEIREIVNYAEKLCIDIIPEIDIPGHTVAFLSAYKELSCLKGDYDVFCKSGITKDILCAGSESTYEFLEKLFGEICSLFPYKYFHIGGDEASHGHKIWEKECPECQKVIRENSLSCGAELQEYFINRVNKIMKKFGKTCIEWNDGMGEKTDDDVVCQYWIRFGGISPKKEFKKRKFIVSPTSHLYFDMCYAKLPLKKVYNFDTVKVGFPENCDNILGFEFETWTEWITDESAVQFSVYPRIFALSEIVWTDDNRRNYKDFYKRLDFYKAYMRSKNINYSRIEKKKLSVRNKSIYSLGISGNEYKYNEKIKEK